MTTIVLTIEQVQACIPIVQAHGWTWAAAQQCGATIGIALPNTGCWPDVGAAGLLGAVCQVACALQHTPDSLQWLSLGGGTLPPGTVLPASLRELYLGGGTLSPGTVLPNSLRELYP